MINILVDADACPTISLIEKLSERHQIPVTYICDTTHKITSSINTVIIVDKGDDSADYKILSLCNQDSIVVTQDYALAGLCLTKKSIVIHFDGFIIDNNNIDTLLSARYLGQKARKAKIKMANQKKRLPETDLKFYQELEKIIKR